MTAVVSVPTAFAPSIGGRISRGDSLPTKEAPGVGRTYFLAPLLMLAGVGVFTMPDVDVEYFDSRAEAMAWASTDIERRRDESRALVRAMVLEGLHGRGIR